MVALSGKKLRDYIRWHESRGISWVVAQGFRWFRGDFLPAVVALERSASNANDRKLLSDAWYVIGDVHDFNEAPRAAMRAYRRSIRWDPKHGESYRELGGMLHRMGRYRPAIQALERAIDLCPEDPYAPSELEWARRSAETREAPFDKPGDWKWQARELIGAGRFREAITFVRRHRGVLAHQYLACCYGGLRETVAVVREWQIIAALSGPIALEHIDWFYAGDAAYDRAEFWQALLDCGNRFWHKDVGQSYGIWIMLSNPFEGICVTADEWNNRKDRKWIETKRRLHCQLNLARTQCDSILASKLARRFPKWREAVTMAEKLNAKTARRQH
jgi:tetratricopeptide (TPR) repeat protein